MPFKVYKGSCKNCLLSPDRIVSAQRAKEIINSCTEEQSYFICHKSSSGSDPQGEEICCHTFHKEFGERSQMIRTCDRLGWTEFVDQPGGDKLPTHNEMRRR